MNFCFAIVAHVDSGKTSICEYILGRIYGTKRKLLDNLKVEQKRGITVKLKQLTFNLEGRKFFFIDTPGHVQFFNEVERSLSIVENVLLVVDTLQGVQSQTKLLIDLLLKQDKKVILVFNKIDICRDRSTITDTISYCSEVGLNCDHVLVSAKTGFGMNELLGKFCSMKPMLPIRSDAEIFDIAISNFGVRCFVRTSKMFRKGDMIVLPNGQEVKLLKITQQYEVEVECESVEANSICIFLVKTKERKIGLGAISHKQGTVTATAANFDLPNMYFQAYPDQTFLGEFSMILNNLIANDPSVYISTVHNSILGTGYNIGVKGKIHAEIVTARLGEVCNFEVIYTNLLNSYKNSSGKVLSNFKEFKVGELYQELFAFVEIQTNQNHISQILDFIDEYRGLPDGIESCDEVTQSMLKLWIPVSQLNNNFYDRIQTLTSGYVLLKIRDQKWFDTSVNLLTILINKHPVEDFGLLCHPKDAYSLASKVTNALCSSLSLRNFNLRVQAKYGGKIISASSIKARKINVVAKCYGGDIRRKMKLWAQQTKGRQKQQASYKQKVGLSEFKDVFKSLN